MHMNRAFFFDRARKKKSYIRVYPVSERMKFVCTVNVLASATVYCFCCKRSLSIKNFNFVV